jgi:hypothetical protein
MGPFPDFLPQNMKHFAYKTLTYGKTFYIIGLDVYCSFDPFTKYKISKFCVPFFSLKTENETSLETNHPCSWILSVVQLFYFDIEIPLTSEELLKFKAGQIHYIKDLWLKLVDYIGTLLGFLHNRTGNNFLR